MAFLTSLDILDTGFLTVNNRVGQLSTANRTNSGVSLRLKSVNIDIQSTSSLDTGVTPAYTPSTIKGHEKRALISINPTTVTITIILKNVYTDTTNVWGINDMGMLQHLLRLPHTKGFKAIYYPVDNAATDTGGNSSRLRNQQIVYQLGATDTVESQGDLATVGSEKVTLWTGTTSTNVGKDLTDVNYIPVRFESCKMNQTPDNMVRVTLSGVVTG